MRPFETQNTERTWQVFFFSFFWKAIITFILSFSFIDSDIIANFVAKGLPCPCAVAAGESLGDLLFKETFRTLIHPIVKVRWLSPCMVAILIIMSYFRWVDRHQGGKIDQCQKCSCYLIGWAVRSFPPPSEKPFHSLLQRKSAKHRLGLIHLPAWTANLKGCLNRKHSWHVMCSHISPNSNQSCPISFGVTVI